MIGPLELLIIILLLTPVVLVARSLMTRRCPRCGKRVRNGLVVCNHCQHEFAT